jgi:hypothetical protein
MDVGCRQRGFAASTMTPHCHWGPISPQCCKIGIGPPTSTISFRFILVQSFYPIFPIITPTPPEQVLQCKGAPICPSTVYESAQTLHIPPIWMLNAVWDLLQPQLWHHNVIWLNLTPPAMTPQHHLAQPYPTCTGVTVRLDPQAQPQHMNVLKHFIYLQYGCGMQFGTSCSLNHDTITSFGSTLPHLHRRYSKVGSTGPTTAYECAQTLHIPPIWMWDAVWDLLQPQPWHHNVIWLNLTPPAQVLQ